MNKIKITLLSSAVILAIGGAFATTQPNDPCKDPLVPRYHGPSQTPVQPGYSCISGPSTVCTYYLNASNQKIQCEEGTYDAP